MQKKINILRLLFILFAVAAMVFIFRNSAQTAEESAGSSGGLLTAFEFLIPGYDNMSAPEQEYAAEKLHIIIRELAHLIEFVPLGLFTALFSLTFTKPRRFPRLLITILFCILYALSDEIHQLFVPGRTFELFDILMDSIGSITGTAAAVFLSFIYHRLIIPSHQRGIR